MAGDLAALVGVDPERLRALMSDLADLNITVAAAESLTGGLLTALLTEVPGASSVIRGGLVVYATDLKRDWVDVDADLLAARGPVDPEVARQLAVGARRRAGATIGLGLTGVAGPDPQGGAAVGTFFVGISGSGADRVISHSPPAASVPSRSAVRTAAVRTAVDLLCDLVHGNNQAPLHVSPTADEHSVDRPAGCRTLGVT